MSEGRARERIGGAMYELVEFLALEIEREENGNRWKKMKIEMESKCGEVEKVESCVRVILPENASFKGKSEVGLV